MAFRRRRSRRGRRTRGRRFKRRSGGRPVRIGFRM